jgi:putative radical SAM enzyme (TIGR03279 family)
MGIEVEEVAAGSPAAKAGVKAGDTLLKVNGNGVSDVIDYCFYKDEYPLRLTFESKEKKPKNILIREENGEPGVALRHFHVRSCRNKCLFCFVSQLPKGLRRTLYVKDEDYRMSFLYGNYITMTNLSQKDRQRIASQRLSPLYISVHATDRKIRNRLLGNPQAEDIMKELSFLKANKIRSHVQIVLCPGINDGEVLKKTIRDLYGFFPYVSSIAIVPVGLTAHRKIKMRPVLPEDAWEALKIIESFQKRFMKKHGQAIVFGADELYIKAASPALAGFPPLSEYGDLPQIENGVGLLPSFLHDAKRLKIKDPFKRGKYLTFTGLSFFPYLKKYLLDKLTKQGCQITVVPVENRFFGTSVTVTGLLTGRDVVRALAPLANSHDILLVPDTGIKEGGDVFLDDLTVADIGSALGIKTRTIEASVKGLSEAIRGE